MTGTQPAKLWSGTWASVRAAAPFFVAVLLLLPFLLSNPAAPAADSEQNAKPKAPQQGDQPAAKAEEVPAEHAKLMAEGLAIYRKSVRTLLAERCLICHNDSDLTEGGLSLSTRDALLRGGKSGKVIVPGKSQESRLYKMVAHLEKPYMPKDEDKLSDKEIAQLAAWIDRYAPYDGALDGSEVETKSWTTRELGDSAREFWSFQPLHAVAPPAVSEESRCRTAIDRFVLARLEAEKLSLSPEVDRRKLIRRASFDLLGLPPDPDDVEAFVNDPSPDAYERLIDRLLSSPHYGERWGRHWLDLARFAESHGFEHDYDRPSAFHYRDFVIQALNDDLPYDTFVKWQLAGDEFAPDKNLAMMATGFLAAGVHSTQITKNEVEKHRYDELDDMLATTGTAMLGLTIGCARCHDHKFDPIPQADYYRLLSAFTTTVRSEVELNFDKEGYAAAKSAFDREHAPLVTAREQFEAEQLPARFQQWDDARSAADVPVWIELDPTEMKSTGGATFKKQEDGSILIGGKSDPRDVWTITARIDGAPITGLRLEALSDPSLPSRGPGRAGDGNFSLSDLKVAIAPIGAPDKSAAVALKNPRATVESKEAPVAAAIDGDGKTGWEIGSSSGHSQAAAFEAAQPAGTAASLVTITLRFEKENLQPGRVRLAVTSAKQPPALDAPCAPAEVVALLQGDRNLRTDEQKAQLIRWYRRIDPQWQSLQRSIDDHLAVAPQPDLRKVLVSSEGLQAVRLHSQGEDFFPETYFLKRGDPNQKEGVAPVGFLQVLMRTPERAEHWQVSPTPEARTSFRRTSLANWITDTEQGAGNLLARVIVNRLWQHHLGRGIVATSSDFGSRGELPTHPDLLDWLAAELIREGWNLKPIHKLILTSSVYRQSSAFRSEAAQVDPDNRLFWRQPPRRLEGEVIRDALLSAGDALDRRMFGPGTLDEKHRRRSIYFTVKRSQLPAMMQVFDAPDALSSMGERPSTTIAPQALMLLNNVGIRDWSEGFARRLLRNKAAGDDATAIRNGYLVALGREPSESEASDALEFLTSQTESYKSENRTDAELAALTDFCQILLCLNEFVYVE